MGADSEVEAKVVAESTDVGAGLAANPKNSHFLVLVDLEQLAFINGADSQLLLDGGYGRRFLKERACEMIKRTLHFSEARRRAMQFHDTYVLLALLLLGLHQASGTVDAYHEHSSH